MLLSHTVTAARVLCATDGFGECHVHDVRVEVPERYRCFDPMITSRWIGEYDVFGHVRSI
jgi:hypothetical protein